MKHLRTDAQQGFTLIEVILTIALIGALAGLLLPFIGTALTDSARPVNRVREEANLEASMEAVIADYVAAVNVSPATALSTLATNIDADAYGTSPAVSYDYITFTNGTLGISGSATTTMRVTITGTDFTLVNLFTTARNATEGLLAF